VHLAIGLAGTYGWLLAAGCGLAFAYGLFAAGNSDINFLSLNGADNGLHLTRPGRDGCLAPCTHAP
jgi:hypothetical protein